MQITIFIISKYICNTTKSLRFLHLEFHSFSSPLLFDPLSQNQFLSVPRRFPPIPINPLLDGTPGWLLPKLAVVDGGLLNGRQFELHQLQTFRKEFRQRCLNFDLLSGDRMQKADIPGMQVQLRLLPKEFGPTCWILFIFNIFKFSQNGCS